MSFQSGGAILGPPGAPGAPVSLIIVMSEPNLLQCTMEKHQRAHMLILQYMSHRTWENRITNKLKSPPVISTSEAPWQSIVFIESWWLVKAKRHCDSQTGVSYPPQDMQHHWYAKRTCFSCSARCTAELTRFAYQLPLLPLIRQFVIWSSLGRHSLICLTGFRPPQRTLKVVTQIRHSNVPSAQCT